MSLANKTLLGVIWSFVDQLLRRGITAFTTLLLAYFLEPEAFGLIAIITVFIAIATSIMDSGFKQALIRLKDLQQKDLSTAFYANLILGFLAYLLLFVSAPYIVSFYQEAELLLLLKMTGLVVIINSFKVVQEAIFSRDLNFKIQLKANIPAALVSSIVAVVLAYLGFGIWALIVQMLLFSTIAVITLWVLSEWRPTLEFDKHSLLSMYNFGYKLLLSGLLDTVFRNVYVVVIAKLFSSTITGFYFLSTKIVEIITGQLVGAIQNATYPALAKVQNDEKKLKESYRSIIILSTFIIFPIFTCLASLAPLIFQTLFPEKWWPAASYLQWLCVGGVLYPLHAINLNVLQVKGRSDLFLYLEIIKKILVLLILLISMRYGVYGILIGQALLSVIAYLPNSYFTAKLIDYPIVEQVKDFMPNMLLSIFVSLITYWIATNVNWNNVGLLFLTSFVAVVSYILMAFFLRNKALGYIREYILKSADFK